MHKSENVQYFMDMAVILGVPEINTFQPSELVFHKKTGGIVTLLEALAEVAHKRSYPHAWPGANKKRKSGLWDGPIVADDDAAATVASVPEPKPVEKRELTPEKHEESDPTPASAESDGEKPPSSGAAPASKSPPRVAFAEPQESVVQEAPTPPHGEEASTTPEPKLEPVAATSPAPSEVTAATAPQTEGLPESPRETFSESPSAHGSEDLQSENAALRARIEELNRENERARGELDSVRNERDVLDKDLRESTKGLDSALSQILALRQEVANANAALQQSAETVSDLQRHLDSKVAPASAEPAPVASSVTPENHTEAQAEDLDNLERALNSLEGDAVDAEPISIKHPDFLNLEARLTSFTSKWPHVSPSAGELAQSGFVHKPSRAHPDRVMCFGCGSRFHSWEAHDDPYYEHAKQLRLKGVDSCPFIASPATQARLPAGELAELRNIHAQWKLRVTTQPLPQIKGQALPSSESEGDSVAEEIRALGVVLQSVEETHSKLNSTLLELESFVNPYAPVVPEVENESPVLHRNRVLAEIFTSERDFVDFLEVALNVFYRPLGRFGVVPGSLLFVLWFSLFAPSYLVCAILQRTMSTPFS
jgi:Inhibitor of Apoptosis domain